MCDYSLETYRSRPARAGEQYVTTHFSSGSVGLTAPGDRQTAVCLMADTRLKLEGIPVPIQQAFGLAASEEAVFVRKERSAWRPAFRDASNSHRDAIRFANGAEVLLQRLGAGIEVSIIDPLEVQLPIEQASVLTRRREPELV
jgi:hypothetical protein